MRFCTTLTVTKEVTNDSRDTVLIRKYKLYFLFMLFFTLHRHLEIGKGAYIQ